MLFNTYYYYWCSCSGTYCWCRVTITDPSPMGAWGARSVSPHPRVDSSTGSLASHPPAPLMLLGSNPPCWKYAPWWPSGRISAFHRLLHSTKRGTYLVGLCNWGSHDHSVLMGRFAAFGPMWFVGPLCGLGPCIIDGPLRGPWLRTSWMVVIPLFLTSLRVDYTRLVYILFN